MTDKSAAAAAGFALPVVADLFADDPHGRAALVGGYCEPCQLYFYPRPDFCPACLQPAQRSLVGGSGQIYSYTLIRTRPPYQLPEPYAVGYVDLDASGLRVFGLFHPRAIGQLRIGLRVDLSVMPLGVDNAGKPCLRPVFTPLAGERPDHDE